MNMYLLISPAQKQIQYSWKYWICFCAGEMSNDMFIFNYSNHVHTAHTTPLNLLTISLNMATRKLSVKTLET